MEVGGRATPMLPKARECAGFMQRWLLDIKKATAESVKS